MKSLRAIQSGFTLVEITVATAITGILIIIIMGFTVNSFAQISVDSARSDLLREAQITLDTMTQDARLSSNAYDRSSISDQNAPGESDFWDANSNTLILATAAQDKNRNILFEDALRYTSYKNNRIYYVDNGTLYRRTLAADAIGNAVSTSCPINKTSDGCPRDSLLAHNVAHFSVVYFNGNGDEVAANETRSVEITLKLSKTKYGRLIEANHSARTVFRNE